MHQIERLLDIEKPLYFQISLEGLEAHNDTIRGQGHFQRSLVFLDQLRERGIYTMVMLTLSRDNIHQALPLATLLKNRADFFTFNRLSTVGEGAQLRMATPEAFQLFLRKYEAESLQNSILGLKDNLINVILNEKKMNLFGGCTGYGCGAAFNFVALLADGEVHACRKFPSSIGNIQGNCLMDIYHSELAKKYRGGSSACRDCYLNLVCRGCLAITYSCGLDVFKDRDPFCFISQETVENQRI
jgi:selenobiotic family peptide radical SAM maturase